MTQQSEKISRRSVVGMLSVPVAAAALGAPALTRRAAAAPAAAENNADLGTRIYNIRDFGGAGDGKALDTKALQDAVDACTKDGGGIVLVPAGTFLIGQVELKSNVTLRIAAGGKLLGSGEGKDYKAVDRVPLQGDSTFGDGNWALLFAVEAKNITVEGPGMIDGNGKQFLPPELGVDANGVRQRGAPPAGLTGAKRPYTLLFHRCENTTVRNIDLFRSAFHMVRVNQCKYFKADGIHIYNRVNHNNDGFHFVSVEYANISNCNVQCQDDACALFGSCKFVTVTNCSFSTRWAVFRFGGGNAENVTVSNCVFSHVYGCPIKIHCSPGSRFENFSFSNLILQDVTGPISIMAGSGGRRATTRPAVAPGQMPGDGAGGNIFIGDAPATEPGTQPATRRSAPYIRNISFNNIHGTVTNDPPQLPDVPFISGYNPGEKFSAIVINCVGDADVANVSLTDIHLTFGGGGTADVAANRKVPKAAGEYFSIGAIPAYGLFARGVKGLTLENVRFQYSTKELRPAVILDNVNDVAINGLSAQAEPDTESVFRVIDSRQVYIARPRVLTPTATFMRIEGAGNEGIVIEGGDLSKAKQAVAAADGAKESAVKVKE